MNLRLDSHTCTKVIKNKACITEIKAVLIIIKFSTHFSA